MTTWSPNFGSCELMSCWMSKNVHLVLAKTGPVTLSEDAIQAISLVLLEQTTVSATNLMTRIAITIASNKSHLRYIASTAGGKPRRFLFFLEE